MANIQIRIYDIELMPKGKPTTVSLNNPAKKLKSNQIADMLLKQNKKLV